ncbi:hypothetical protein J1605_014140 [Eschrichtius robustus]|uniref:protein-tyrosine-phosphatase n=1 Tax=Eschrichtius robustus TaxID=9764 RepID=A0AB34GFD3_ESCRO|nr:hypothetical protein J1605_014140 [Eschrichtius robustus]
MSRSLDAARSFLEQLEARGGREGAVLAGEFSVSGRVGRPRAALRLLALDGPDDIRARSASWKTDSMCSTEAGSRPENVRKNRYKDVLPYDQTRVILSLLQEEGHGDYINGNFIRVRLGVKEGAEVVEVILMACQEMENGRKKCERYWAQEQEPLQIGLFCITLTRETWLNADIMLRTLQVTFQKMIPPNFSLFNVVLEIRRQRPAAIQTEEQYRFLYHTVAQMFLSALQSASPRYQNLKEVPRPPSNPRRPGPRAEVYGHLQRSIQPLDSFRERGLMHYDIYLCPPPCSLITVPS